MLSGNTSLMDGVADCTDSWQLHAVGDWLKRRSNEGLTGGGIFAVNQQSDDQNVLNLIRVWTAGDLASPTPNAAKIEYRHDAAGNLIFDGQYWYSYDAWNHLVGVDVAAEDATNSGGYAVNTPMYGLRIGAWLKRYTYDGLGRLIETRSPYIFVPGTLAVESYSSKIARIERFYYDGARRIQEVVTDPLDPQYVLNTYGFEGLVELVQSGAVNEHPGSWR